MFAHDASLVQSFVYLDYKMCLYSGHARFCEMTISNRRFSIEQWDETLVLMKDGL